MAAAAPKQWGLTPPLSTALPTDKDNALNDSLIAELKANNNYEAPEATAKRTEVLKSLQKITVEFVKRVAKMKGFSQSRIDSCGGKIFTFGSFRLGVFGPGSDIDTLLVVPKHVNREDFFKHFPKLLDELAPKGAISELKPVEDAFVPIIKLEYSDISIDLIFARLLQESVPTSLDLKDNSLLRGLDETDLRCLNGTRVTDEILTLVPQVKTFRVALRAIKLWAQRRAIYANVMGFPGGVAWAMMVARICQFYPQASGSTIVHRFFTILADWKWPMPIQLKQIEDGPLANVRIWNPVIYPSDKRHLMPVITPAYPSMCATHNITYSTQKIILRELSRARDLTNQIVDGRLKWKDLFKKHTFFSEGYKYYLSIVAASKTKDAQLIWSGLVESKVRRLVSGIEMSQTGVEIAHPFNKGFERVHHCKKDDEIDQVLQGSLAFQASDIKVETTDDSDPARNAVAEGNNENLPMPKAEGEEEKKVDGEANGEKMQTIYTTTYYIGIELSPGSKSLDISYPVGDFKRMCTDWQSYDENLNSIRIIHTRNYDLPADLFEEGETRPQKAKKAKGGKLNEVASKKRSFAESTLESCSGPIRYAFELVSHEQLIHEPDAGGAWLFVRPSKGRYRLDTVAQGPIDPTSLHKPVDDMVDDMILEPGLTH